MSKVIWKFPLYLGDNAIGVPDVDARILSLQMQGDTPTLWILLDPSAKTPITRYFKFYGTGHTTQDPIGAYIGTVQLEGGRYIFHLFEVTPQAEEAEPSESQERQRR